MVVSCLATVRHIQRFLARRFALDEATHAAGFHLHLVGTNFHVSPTPLAAELSLHRMLQDYLLDAAALHLRFRFAGELPPEEPPGATPVRHAHE